MGDLWPRHEFVMDNVIKIFSNNTKIVMPQTCYLSKYDNYYEEYRKNLIIF